MQRWNSCLLLVFLGFHAAAAEPLKAPVGEIQGSLIIAGGGNLPDAVRDRFIELAGGKQAKIVVIAGEGADADKALEPWKKQDVESVGLFKVDVKPLTEATGVWLAGADRPKLVEKELLSLLKRGGVICGASGAFLPGVIVVSRERRERLAGLLKEQPGHFGLGIDDETAVVVMGRELKVIGNANVTVLQSPGAGKQAGVRTFKPGQIADLVALSREAVARTRPAFPPEKPDPPKVEKGALIIGGGGGLDNAVWKKFIDLAGGPDSLILVIPTANPDPLPKEPPEQKALIKAGAKNVKLLHTRSQAEAQQAAFVAPIEEAKGVWFSGGRQWRFVDSYEGTAAEKAFHDVLKRGGVIGGSSAGASIQSEYMPRGDPLGNLNIIAEGYERGFGFLKGVAVDQHFFARKRTEDMTELMTRYPQLLGIGIDEGTIILVQGSTMEVIGKSKVAVYDRKKAVKPGEKDYEELPAGAKYDLVERKRLP